MFNHENKFIGNACREGNGIMRGKEELKRAVDEAIEARRETIAGIAEQVFRHPETGFREVATSRLAAETLRALGLPVREGLALTGVRGDYDSGRAGPKIALLGEMDSLILPGAEGADPETGAFHACGHHTHIASMLGAAMGLTGARAAEECAGAAAFIACPGEECIELEFRRSLMESGVIGALGGKPALIRAGAFDDIDAAVMIHIASGGFRAMESNGFVKKIVHFRGKSCHAASPSNGINALNAANLALHAIALLRETLADNDHVRIHGILSHGGDSINIIPDDACLEYQIRAGSIEKIYEVSEKFDRAMRGSAMAVGAREEIVTLPGYLPMRNDCELYEKFIEEARIVYGDPKIEPYLEQNPGSTDMGDVSAIMPAIHPFAPGARGGCHRADFRVPDVGEACTRMAKVMARLAVDLLYGDAEWGRELAERKHEKCLTKEQYLRRSAELCV